METTVLQPLYNGESMLFTFDNGLKRILEPLKMSEFDLEKNKDREILIVTKDNTLRKGKYVAQYPDEMLALNEDTNMGRWLMDLDPDRVKYIYPMWS